VKRDMDLAREILKAIEESPEASGYALVDIKIPDRSEREISYHVMLLNEAGLVEALDLSDTGGIEWGAQRLAWAGHEFLDAYRRDTLWNKAKAVVMEKTGSLSFEALKQALPIVIKSALGG
jgi:repressor of nif and glnA expression